MKAMVINEFGGPEVFTAAEIDAPRLKPGHVIVRIAATSVNTVDTCSKNGCTKMTGHLDSKVTYTASAAMDQHRLTFCSLCAG